LRFQPKLFFDINPENEKPVALQNRLALCHDAPSWKFGMTALIRSLAARGLPWIVRTVFKEFKR
jgi:hypothetical protein